MEMLKEKRIKDSLNFKKIISILAIILAIILIFTFIDYIVHSLKEEYAVPSYYFRNKIIFGTGIGFVTYLLMRKKKPFIKALIFSSVVAVLLQTRYFLEGYSLSFVFLFLILHFLMLLPISWLVFLLNQKYKNFKTFYKPWLGLNFSISCIFLAWLLD